MYNVRHYIRNYFETSLADIKKTNTYLNDSGLILFQNNLNPGNESKTPFIRYWFGEETTNRLNIKVYECELELSVYAKALSKRVIDNDNDTALLSESLLYDLSCYFTGSSQVTAGKSCNLQSINTTIKTIGQIKDITIKKKQTQESGNSAEAMITVLITYIEYL